MHRIHHPSKFRISLSIIFIALLLCGLDRLDSQIKKAEDFVLYSIDGKRTVFYDILGTLPKEGVLLVNFTSIHCKPCRKEIPELVRITGSASGRARLICIYSESGREVQGLAAELNILDKTYVDPFGNIRKQHDVTKIPVTFVIGKNYTILGRYDGYTDGNIKNIESIVLK